MNNWSCNSKRCHLIFAAVKFHHVGPFHSTWWWSFQDFILSFHFLSRVETNSVHGLYGWFYIRALIHFLNHFNGPPLMERLMIWSYHEAWPTIQLFWASLLLEWDKPNNYHLYSWAPPTVLPVSEIGTITPLPGGQARNQKGMTNSSFPFCPHDEISSLVLSFGASS